VRKEFEAIGIELNPFRSRLRALIGRCGVRFSGGVLHRSKACKWIFVIGEAIAAHEGAALTPRHVLRASFIASSFDNSVAPREDSSHKPLPDDDLPEEL
jgi:hypothetical protein